MMTKVSPRKKMAMGMKPRFGTKSTIPMAKGKMAKKGGRGK